MDSIFVEARGCDGRNLLFYRKTVLFSGFASRQWFKNVLDVEEGEIMSIILLTRGSCFNQTRTNLRAERLCKNGGSEGSGRKPRYMCRVKQLLMTVFPGCEVDQRQSRRFVHSLNQSVIRELFVWS